MTDTQQELEAIDNVRSLDMKLMIAQLVGAVQAQSDKITALSIQNGKLSDKIAKQSDATTALTNLVAKQSEQISVLMKHIHAQQPGEVLTHLGEMY